MRILANKEKDDMIKKVAIGATGLALATGAVVAGVALTNKKTRTRLTRGAKKTFGRVQQTIGDAAERYQTYQHKIGGMKVMKKKKGKK